MPYAALSIGRSRAKAIERMPRPHALYTIRIHYNPSALRTHFRPVPPKFTVATGTGNPPPGRVVRVGRTRAPSVYPIARVSPPAMFTVNVQHGPQPKIATQKKSYKQMQPILAFHFMNFNNNPGRGVLLRPDLHKGKIMKTVEGLGSGTHAGRVGGPLAKGAK